MTSRHRLIVMRHAKAADLPGGADFDRPLRPRGSRDAAAAGQWLGGRGLLPDLVLCSAAMRTRQTCDLVVQALGSAPQTQFEQRLYLAGADEVLQLVRQTPQDVGTLMYVGHNPAAAQLAALLTGTEAEFPTAAVAVLAVGEEWAGTAAGSGDLLAAWSPRQAGQARGMRG